MSNRRKIQPPTRQVEVAVMPGACLNVPEQIEAMKRQTHDGLIDMLGPARCSGVWWKPFYGRAACREALDLLYPAEPDRAATVAAGLDQFRAYFDEHGDQCVLIIASCKAYVWPRLRG